jgi:GH35 family endo-1,4-beta-xylanase
MKNFIFCLFLIFFVISCTSIPVHINPDGRHVPVDFTGICHAGRTGTDTEFQQLDYLCAVWTLYTFGWNRIEAVQGEWDFSYYDKITNDCIDSNIKVIGILAYDAAWIHEVEGRSRYIPPDKLPDFLLYVRKTVEHFRGRVDAWCIWNEPNFNYFWKGTEEEFIELSLQTANVIREVDTDVIILAGAFNRLYFFP